METSNLNPKTNPNPNPSSMRVLIRPPSSSASTPTLTSSSSLSQAPLPPPVSSSSSDQPSTSSQSRSSDGVVVVGFIGGRPGDTAQLINRVIDSNVFGSGNRDKSLCIEKEEVRDWFKWRRISYYHEEQRGILFLQFCYNQYPAMDGFNKVRPGFDSVVEEHEFGDLQGMLFMFSVCHVIIYIQEGSRFDTQLLKKFRVLQAAKHALAPFSKSRSMPALSSRPHSSASSRSTTSASSSNNSSPGRSGSIMSRNASAISLMSGLGSYTSLFPGQCTPVMLFVFVDDFSDIPNTNSTVDETTETSSHNQLSGLSLARPSLPAKVSGSVVVLARPVSKSESSFRKKLQSSLEAQVRFLIKKCRTLSGSETSHAGSRSGGASSSAPLFSLDASRAVVLLDRLANQRGESLEFATGIVEDVLIGKATSDSLLSESNGQGASRDDIISLKEFIFRQSDILRGRGGLASNSNSGQAAGVGMVAVAAAAAAASVASGKLFNTPDLPNIEIWLSSSLLILHGVLSAKGGCLEEIENSKRKPRLRNTMPQAVEGISSKVMDPLDLAVSWLESGKGLNTKFSTLWCERNLPAAKEVYLKDLPSCYPTSQHESHLEKALHAFHSMVKGPTVQGFSKRLEDECTHIWKSGRQLCDAVSLTGKPCMHQRHDVETDELVSLAVVKPHSSGYVFLHACACGRTRRLRPDPFDFESANVTSNCFPNCDKLLPALQLPNVANAGPIRPSSWSLIRVGGARYYEPSKGLLQSGFCATQKFLLKWTIFLEKLKRKNGLTDNVVYQGSVIKSNTDPKFEPEMKVDSKSSGDLHLYSEEVQSGVENQRRSLENVIYDDKKISFGKGLPNFTMRKPFAEVVAGSAVADSAFPPLRQRKQHSSSLDGSIKQNRTGDRSMEQTTDHQESQKAENILSAVDTLKGTSANGTILRIGSNVVPVNLNSGEKIKMNPSSKHVTMYVGFEHECPHGHRFLLNPEHLNELGTLYQLHEESQTPSLEISESDFADPSKLSKNSLHGKVHRISNRVNGNGFKRERNMGRSKELVTNGFLNSDGVVQFSGSGKEQDQTFFDVSKIPSFVKDLEEGMKCINVDDGGYGFSMLNRNLPVYLNCPHCRLSKNKKDLQNVKFAGTMSQLQRIFVVTPPFPVVLATCPVIQFAASCLPSSIPEREKKLQFSLGCQVVLPPKSFLTLRIPFVYGVQLVDGSLRSLNYFEHQPELTAWIVRGTALHIMSKRNNLDHD
ncbi:hypothetical protein FNV43_RR05612 [Rhamnella rubrinervis]|uniref:Nonsense-mediated mRNA decay factor SMG8 n=1 Tax=Rhamnella rubrinervis TaxID=2594499 RepID=A0A8K0MR96_9ROSA|nr:hypothetical protein FNV43_RR05612 [Rhamnella rubrinervis]